MSSYGSDFNYDFHVSFTKEQLAEGEVDYNYGMVEGYDELPGLSVFYKDENGDVFHTYSSYARGNEEVIGASSISTSRRRAATRARSWTGWRRDDEYEPSRPARRSWPGPGEFFDPAAQSGGAGRRSAGGKIGTHDVPEIGRTSQARRPGPCQPRSPKPWPR